MDKKKILGIVKWLWLVLVLAAAGYYFYRNREQVTNLLSQLSAWRIMLSLILLLIGKMFLVLLVQFSVNTEGWHPKYTETLGIYGISSLGKYIPGGVWHFVGRFGVYKINGLSAKASTRALVLENIWLLGSAVATGVVGVFLIRFDLIADLLHLPNQKWLAVIFTVAALGLWLLVLALVHKIMRRYTTEDLPSIFLVAAVGLVLWTFIGGSFFVMFQEFPASAAPLFIGGYAVSWAVGYIAVFAPGGLGIREAVLSFVFSNIATVEMIAVYAAMNRIIWVIAEVMFGLVGMLQKKIMAPEEGYTDLSLNSKEDPDISIQENL
ncbi:MAG: hypothetical protein GX797_07530 [Chloroflexi bacterium]|nr:hypothetical protein [Chloroflexota bacterium]